MTGSLTATAGTALECVYQHRLLSTSQLGHMLGIWRPRRIQELLAGLADRGLIAFVGQRGVSHRPMRLWFVTEAGADVVEAVATRAEPRRKLLTTDQAGGQLQDHTVAVNDVGLAFLRAARDRPEDECGPLAWRHEIVHPIGPRRGQVLIADSLLRYLHVPAPGTVRLQYRFVELDRATVPVDTLADKIGLYAGLAHHTATGDTEPLWRRHYPTLPAVLVVLTGNHRAALRRRLDNAAALCRSNPALAQAPEVSASLCLLDDLTEHGPFADIFTPTTPTRDPGNWLGDTRARR